MHFGEAAPPPSRDITGADIYSTYVQCTTYYNPAADTHMYLFILHNTIDLKEKLKQNKEFTVSRKQV
jgi:hypothetical protein